MGSFIENLNEIDNRKNTATEKLLMLIENHFRNLFEDHHLAIVTQLNYDNRIKNYD